MKNKRDRPIWLIEINRGDRFVGDRWVMVAAVAAPSKRKALLRVLGRDFELPNERIRKLDQTTK